MRLGNLDEAKKKLFSYYSFVNENTHKSNYMGETLMSYEVTDMIEDCMANTPTIDPESLPIVQELREEIAELKKLCDKLEEAERAVAHLTPDWIKKLKPGDKVLSSTPNIFTPTLRIRTVKSVNKNFTVETTNGALYEPRLGIDNVVHLYRTGRWVGPFYFVPWYDELIPTTEERLKEAYYQAVGKHDEEATEIEELLRRKQQ